MNNLPEFQEFRKIPRLSREIIISEKIDGTNGVIYIDSADNIFAGSRNRWLWNSVQDKIDTDNHGFAAWVKEHKEELLRLGEGYHYGEWWGKGIQRGYGMEEKLFSLFNVYRWKDADIRPICCEIVPILYDGIFSGEMIGNTLMTLKEYGSKAAPGFMKPEGIVIYHTQGRLYFKKTLENDEKGKNEVK